MMAIMMASWEKSSPWLWHGACHKSKREWKEDRGAQCFSRMASHGQLEYDRDDDDDPGW